MELCEETNLRIKLRESSWLETISLPSKFSGLHEELQEANLVQSACTVEWQWDFSLPLCYRCKTNLVLSSLQYSKLPWLLLHELKLSPSVDNSQFTIRHAAKPWCCRNNKFHQDNNQAHAWVSPNNTKFAVCSGTSVGRSWKLETKIQLPFKRNKGAETYNCLFKFSMRKKRNWVIIRHKDMP